MASSERKLEGVVGFFESSHVLIEAMRKVKGQNYESFDAFTPFPVHGLDDAQGLKRSKLPYVTFTFGLLGTCCAFLLQYWTSAVDWPLNVGGKPLNSWPAFVPIIFEVTILFAGISTLLGLLFFTRLPNIVKRSFDPSITRDRFAIIVDYIERDEYTSPPKDKKGFQEQEVSDFLKSIGATEVRKVYAEGWF